MIKTAEKRALSPRSAKKVAPKPAAKGRKAATQARAARKPAKVPSGRTSAPASRKAAKGAKATNGPTKAEQLIEMLRQPGGVSMLELTGYFGTLEHSLRAAISVQTRKSGLTVELKDGRYRIVG